MNANSGTEHVNVKRMNRTADGNDRRSGVTPEQVRTVVARFRQLTWLLDNMVKIPGTKFRFGLDPILGIMPGAGDVVSAGISTWMILDAKRIGIPKHILLAMAANVGIDFLVGLAPVVGDGLDFIVKANARNLKLLEKTLREMGYDLEDCDLN